MSHESHDNTGTAALSSDIKIFLSDRRPIAVSLARMFLWILALVLVVSLGVVGYYQGALRAAFTLVGLIVASLTAKPVAVLFNFILPALGLSHPAVLDFVSPIAAFILVLTAFKVGAFALHKKVDTWYKYKSSDTERLLWERLNARVGIAIGVANAFLYTLILSNLIYTIGYFTTQVATHPNESWVVKVVNRLSRDIRSTGMNKAIAPFNPATETYYDTSDVLADLFHNPLLQNRLANYPIFLTLGDQPELKAFTDAKFQEQWASGLSMREFADHETVKPVLQNSQLFTNVLALARPDLKDLKQYLESGVSPKYDEEKILGRWQFNFRASISEARRRKPTIGPSELKRLRALLGTAFNNATVVATVDNKTILKLPAAQGRTTQGVWSSAGGGQYLVRVTEGGNKMELQVFIEGRRMTFVRDGVVLVFENTRV